MYYSGPHLRRFRRESLQASSDRSAVWQYEQFAVALVFIEATEQARGLKLAPVLEDVMSLTRWLVCLLASVLSFGLVVNAAEEKKEEKKTEKKTEKKDEKKEEKKDEKKPVVLPALVKTAWDARYKGASVLEIKDKKDSFEIKGKDALNVEFKAIYGADGKLWSEGKRKVAMGNIPAPVAETAKKWAPAAKWAETAEVETKKAEPTKWTVNGTVGEKNVKAEIAEDGKVIKADKLPEAKTEKKEEKAEKKTDKNEEKAEKKAEKKEEKK